MKSLTISLRRTILIGQQLEEFGVSKDHLELVSGMKGNQDMVIIRYSTPEEMNGTNCGTAPFPPEFYDRRRSYKH